MTSRSNVFEEGRGHTRGYTRGYTRGHSDLDYAAFESMVLIASKHNLDPKHLVDAFFESWEDGSSRCGGLTISCREADQDEAVFLVTKGEKVVWQYPVSLESLRNPRARECIKTIPMPEEKEKRSYDKHQSIEDLRFGMKGINVTGTIVEIPPARRVVTRWGAEAYVSNVKLADEDEAIRCSLWNHQIDTVQVGDEVEVRNCSVSRFAGELQLRLGRNGSLSVIDPPQNEELIQHPGRVAK